MGPRNELQQVLSPPPAGAGADVQTAVRARALQRDQRDDAAQGTMAQTSCPAGSSGQAPSQKRRRNPKSPGQDNKRCLPGSASPLHSGQTAAGSRAGSRKPRSSIYGISCPWGLFFPDLWHLKGHLKHQCTKSTALPKAFLAFPQTIFIAAHVLAVQSPSETCFPPHLQHLAWQSILSWGCGCGFLVVCVCTRVL